MARTAIDRPAINLKMGLAVTTALASVALAGCTTGAAPRAEASYSQAQIALEKGKLDKAVSHAEAAVLAEPRNASYRAALGATYLEAGRFQAAATSFGDAIDLGDSDPRTILSFALAQTAIGNQAQAISTLEEWQNNIDPADLGLAFALAGLPDRGVHILANALRNGQNNAKVRQNLAYSYALQGNWRAARIMAAEDVPANMIDDRIAEWAQTAHYEGFQARVAKLLQVTPSVDSGQPRHLALANFPSHQQMVAEAAQALPAVSPVENADQPGVALPAAPRQAELAPAVPAASQQAVSQNNPPQLAGAQQAANSPSGMADAAMAAQGSSAGETRFVSRPVVQKIAASNRAAAPRPSVTHAEAEVPQLSQRSSQRRMAATNASTNGAAADRGDNAGAKSGTHLVQLGSFSSRDNAERAWAIYQQRYPQLAGHDKVITRANVDGKTYYRVAAGGFGAKGAANLCNAVKSQGAGCFAYAQSRKLPGTVNREVRVAAR